MKYLLLIFITLSCVACNPDTQESTFTFPDEQETHEGTWLQWPHDYTYGEGLKVKLEPIWIEMTKHLVKGENVHIVVYNEEELYLVEERLYKAGVDIFPAGVLHHVANILIQ